MSMAVIWLFVVCCCFALFYSVSLCLPCDLIEVLDTDDYVLYFSIVSEQQFQTLQQPNPLLSPLMTTFSTSDP